MTDKEVMQMALETLDNMVKVDWREWDEFASVEDFVRWAKSRASFTAEALRAALAQPERAECDGGQCGIGGYCKQCPKTQPEPVLEDIEQYRLQMAAISTAAIGYWKQGDGIRPEYDTLALRDVTTLYEKYAALHKTQPELEPVAFVVYDSESNDIVWAKAGMHLKQNTPLYTAPPQREWVGLTDEEIRNEANHHVFDESFFTGAVWARGQIMRKNNG
jgi:hypothetical protein